MSHHLNCIDNIHKMSFLDVMSLMTTRWHSDDLTGDFKNVAHYLQKDSISLNTAQLCHQIMHAHTVWSTVNNYTRHTAHKQDDDQYHKMNGQHFITVSPTEVQTDDV